MLKKIKPVIRFIKCFGVFNGTLLFTKFFLGKVEKIKLPGIKHPFTLRRGSSDIPTFNQVFLDQEYDIPYTGKPSVIIDGGANIGLFAIKIKNDFPEAKIVCIEPDPENFELLKKNLSPYPNIYFENSGLWNRDTRLNVYDKFNAGKWAMVVEENAAEGKISAISIQSLMARYGIDHIDLLKLDIETSEKQLFAENYEGWLPGVKMIVIELHDRIEEGCSKPFFVAVNKSIQRYTFFAKGENVIIRNNDL